VGVRGVNIRDAYNIKFVLKKYIAVPEVVGHNQIFLLIKRSFQNFSTPPHQRYTGLNKNGGLQFFQRKNKIFRNSVTI